MRRALITGGSGDIGSAICRQLASAGMHVYVHASSRLAQAEKIAGEIKAAGGAADAIAFDITSAQATRAAVEALIKEQPLEVLVHSAGIHDDAPLAGMSEQKWHRVIDVSLNGFYNVTQPLLLSMLRGRWGRIIAISSVAGQIGNRGQANYAAAKAGLHGACMSLAKEVASRGVTVNVVAPGMIAGSMTSKIFTTEQVKNIVPAARMGTPDEVAALVAFLASDNAAYISSQVIGVNGALT
jgi:3-oxoacyl-[acyl-carrier protein] reductase